MTEPINFELPGVKKLIASDILKDIDSAAIKLYTEPPRSHLGASIIGKACSRQLWYGFRWCEYESHNGRQMRLFNRGHKEEERFIEWLSVAGYRVQAFNPDTGKQWRVSALNGHFGGSLDGKIWINQKWNYQKPLLLEFKTNATGAGFNNLLANGCEIEKPIHFDQQCIYGHLEDLDYSLYLNVCKNDDNIYPEIVELDKERGKRLVIKAERIIFSKKPPERLSNNSSHFECKFCAFREICFIGKPAQHNCRSCKNSTPVENAEWHCAYWGQNIPKDFLIKGCEHWQDITKE